MGMDLSKPMDVTNCLSDFEGETPQKWSPKLNHPFGGIARSFKPNYVVALDQFVHCETEDDWVSANQVMA